MFSLAGWVPFYFLFNEKKGADQGLFFMNSFNKHTFRRMNSMYEIGGLKSLIKRTLPKVEVESKIYIKIPINDQLDRDNNLKSKRIPEMVSENLDIPFEVNIKNYDPSEYLKMRVITCEDWGTVNWKTGEIENETDEVRHIEVALLYVHGGAFVSGSSGTYQTVLRKYATSTGYPIFAVDYRLAPDHKFPIPLSDSWLAYLWLRYYSEKYLRIKIDKIILVGDSAGSWISFSMCSLAIRKKVILPDGNVCNYPGFCWDKTNFTPSLLLSVDEPYINTFMIDMWLESYLGDWGISKHFLWSPISTPKRILRLMPPTRMGFAGIDPLRDSGIELFRRWVKAGVNCKGKLYKHLFHGYLEMDTYPFKMEDCRRAYEDSIEFIEQIVHL